MKTKRTILALIFLTLLAIAVMLADTTITITIPTADETRYAEAFGSILNLKDASGNPRPATAAEIQGAYVTWSNGQVSDYEKRKNMAQFSPPPLVLGTPIELPNPSMGMVKAATPKPTPKKK